MPYEKPRRVVLSDARDNNVGAFYLLAKNTERYFAGRRPVWDVLRTSWPDPLFFWGKASLEDHGFIESGQILTGSPGVLSAEYGNWTLHIGHGCPSLFYVDDQGQSVPLAVMAPGRRSGGTRYLWLLSCNVLAHGKRPYVCPDTFRFVCEPSEEPEESKNKYEDVFDRWGRNYGDAVRQRSPLGGGVRLVCGGSTTIVIRETALDSSFEAMFDCGWAVADAFVHGLVKPSQTPLVISQGNVAPSVAAWYEHPLWDRELHEDNAEKGTHIFIQYPRCRKRIESFEGYWRGDTTEQADEPPLDESPCELPLLELKTSRRLLRLLNSAEADHLRSISALHDECAPEQASIIALYLRARHEYAGEWREGILKFSRNVLSLLFSGRRKIGKDVEFADEWRVDCYEMAVAWRKKPDCPYGNPPGPVTRRKKSGIVGVSPRFLVRTGKKTLAIPFRDPFGFFCLRLSMSTEAIEGVALFPFEADLAIRPHRVVQGRSVEIKKIQAAIDEARLILDEQRIDTEGFYKREASDVLLEYQLQRSYPVHGGARLCLTPHYVVRFPPVDERGPARQIEVEAAMASD